MTELEERELSRVRLLILDICKSFFDEAPDAQRFARWRGLFAALLQEQVEPVLDRTVRDLYDRLNRMSLVGLQEEHYRLFVDPFGETQVPVTASEYRDGRSYGRTLAEFRGFLQEAGIRQTQTGFGAEDSVVVMLDVMARLVESEREAFEEARRRQAELLDRYLEPLVDRFAAAITETTGTEFYPVCARFLKRYLELERGLSSGDRPSDDLVKTPEVPGGRRQFNTSRH